ARRPGRPRRDGPEDLFRLRVHGSIRLGQREARRPCPTAGRPAGEERLGANCPQGYPASTARGPQEEDDVESERPAPVAPTAREEPHDDQEDRGPEEGHDHRADDWLAGVRVVEVADDGEHDPTELPPDDVDD